MQKEIMVRLVVMLSISIMLLLLGCGGLPVRYPAVPTANPFVEQPVPITTLERIVDAHAHALWGEYIARGRPLPLADENGDVVAYEFPYILGSSQFPEYQEIFDTVRLSRPRHQKVSEADDQVSTKFHTELGQIVRQFGSICASARRTNFPIIRASHYLHPYFLVGDLVQEEAERHFGSRDVQLEKIYFLGPHQEYFEFVSQEDRVLINMHSLELEKSEKVLASEIPDFVPPEMMRRIELAWKAAEESAPIGIHDDGVMLYHTYKTIPYWQLIPPVDWTHWCAITSLTMALGFWDNYAEGVGTILGYGRLIDYWFEHPGPDLRYKGNNVPNIIDELVETPGGADEAINSVNGYSFLRSGVEGNDENDWAWGTLRAEIDSGRPAVWEIFNHAGHSMTAFGYRITAAGKFVVLYNTWGKSSTDQRDEWHYAVYKGSGPASRTAVVRILPGGGTNGDHLIIISPDGGETFYKLLPHEISWYVWGSNIKKVTLEFSADGGNNWNSIASGIDAKPGWNSYVWRPGNTTEKARMRIKGYTADEESIAGDGSQENFSVKTAILRQLIGRIEFLRVHELGTGYGPPDDFLDTEVVVRLDSDSDRSLGLQLRRGPLLQQREKMFSILQDAFSRDKEIVIEYVETTPTKGVIFRVWEKWNDQ